MTAQIGYPREYRADGSQVQDSRRDALFAAGFNREHVYEYGAPGSLDKVTRLDACLNALRRDDTLIHWKLDLPGRDLRYSVNTVGLLTKRGSLKVLAGKGAPLNTSTASNRIIFAGPAKFERDLVVKRARADLVSDRVHGRHGRRPFKMTPNTLRYAQASLRKPEIKVAELRVELGVARQTSYRYVTPKGKIRPSSEKLLAPRAL